MNSPETYFGWARNPTAKDGEQVFYPVDNLSKNKLYLEGKWDITSEYAENIDEASITFRYDSKDVYMTAGSDIGTEIEVYKDDVLVKKIIIKDETLYTLIEGNDYGEHILKIKIKKPGLKAFTFTFG